MAKLDSRTAVSWVPALLGVLVLAWNLSRVYRFTVDDAYITLRYSRHLAQGLGAIYNATGPRAEGYTSFSWMALLAVPHLLHLDALLAAKALGVLATAGTCVLVGIWVHSELGGPARTFATAAAIAVYAAMSRTAIHAVSGMETGPFTFMLTAMLFASTRVVRDGKKWVGAFALAALATALTRPEAILAVFVAAATTAALVAPPVRRPFVVTTSLLCAVPVALYEFCRIRYYGLIAPLPFYVKVSSPGAFPGFAPVAEWLGSELRYGIPLVLVLSRPKRHFLPLLVAVLTLTAFFVIPQHLMGYESRYLAPLDPAVCALFGVGIGRLGEQRSVAMARAIAIAIGLTALPLALSIHEARAFIDERVAYADGLAAAHETLGRRLARLRLPGPDPRIAVSDAGAIPYLSDWWTLDLVGLNEAHIAVTGAREPAFVLGQRLTALILMSTHRDTFVPDTWNTFERPLYDAATAAGFTKADVLRFASDYWLWVLVRPGTAYSADGRTPS